MLVLYIGPRCKNIYSEYVCSICQADSMQGKIYDVVIKVKIKFSNRIKILLEAVANVFNRNHE